ncbi:uncharacterized protein N7458_001685 [Penicillium daleae]|uniref:Rhodopsin domain-containing protein n=1 Tax=Penicillium daleae TaxID=63821 RepID=A0AAD6G6G0_9EURO|nr:uncharacterized protein N7458_001685 [Penicillium daleae]KAJ5460133.1 hypothetical protein N7458_001685 [Penicillium daleae]
MAFCACMLILNSYGGGYNAWDVPETEFIKFQKAFYTTTLIYVPMVFIIKIALLSVMGRVFAPHRPLASCCVIMFQSFSSRYSSATPSRHTSWVPPVARKVIIANSVISIAGDLWILDLPVLMIWSRQMTLAKKMRVVGILGAGGLATGNAEAAISLICACLPAMNYFFTTMKNMRSNTTERVYLKNNELESWQTHSSRSVANKSSESLFLSS